MPTSLGPLPQPLGLTRLQVASLVTSLVGANHVAINAELASLGTVDVLVVCHKFLLLWFVFALETCTVYTCVVPVSGHLIRPWCD